MKKIIAIIALMLIFSCLLTACGVDGKDGIDGKDGLDGKDGVDGRDGVDGKDGVTPTIEISEDGYWVINGEKTEYKAVAEKCCDGDCSCDCGDDGSLTLKELRLNGNQYDKQKVTVVGTVTHYENNIIYIESYDPKTNMNYGIQLFDGYNDSLSSIFVPGNKVRVVGWLINYYGVWQICDIKYNRYTPDNPECSGIISIDNEIPFTEITAEELVSDITVINNGEEQVHKFAYFITDTSVSMKNLEVVSVESTHSDIDNSAMIITCQVDGQTVQIKTPVLKDADGNVVTEEYFIGKTIDVKGFVDCYDYSTGNYYIRVYSLDNVTIH